MRTNDPEGAFLYCLTLVLPTALTYNTIGVNFGDACQHFGRSLLLSATV